LLPETQNLATSEYGMCGHAAENQLRFPAQQRSNAHRDNQAAAQNDRSR
jgi:hypothetical protein